MVEVEAKDKLENVLKNKQQEKKPLATFFAMRSITLFPALTMRRFLIRSTLRMVLLGSVDGSVGEEG